MMKFSVLMSVYSKESPNFFRQALESLVNQTKVPNEIVLVKDGLLTKDLDDLILEYVLNYPNLIKIVSLSENKGLGNALSVGLLECSNELVARMDTDDICVPNRFEKQINFLTANLDVDVVGSNVEEFNKVPGDLRRYREMPEKGKQLLKYSKFRNPINHPTVVYRKAKVLEAGNYNGGILLFEDYSLFIRMIKNGANFYNIQESLLNFRSGSGIEVIRRRSGFLYVKNEWKFSVFALRIKHLNFVEWLFYVLTKLPLRLLPPRVILYVYNSFLRN